MIDLPPLDLDDLEVDSNRLAVVDGVAARYWSNMRARLDAEVVECSLRFLALALRPAPDEDPTVVEAYNSAAYAALERAVAERDQLDARAVADDNARYERRSAERAQREHDL